MTSFLLKLWPSLIPILGFALWWMIWGKKNTGPEITSPFKTRTWRLALLSSLVIAILCLLLVGVQNAPNDGEYVPAKTVDGKVVPGHLKETPETKE